MPIILALRRRRQAGLGESEVSLIYIHSEFQDSQGYIVRCCVKEKYSLLLCICMMNVNRSVAKADVWRAEDMF